MPKYDGTGPQGAGLMTGRGMGPCGGGGRRGCCGFNMRGRFFSRKNELQALEENEVILEEELKAIKEEIQALKNAS